MGGILWEWIISINMWAQGMFHRGWWKDWAPLGTCRKSSPNLRAEAATQGAPPRAGRAEQPQEPHPPLQGGLPRANSTDPGAQPLSLLAPLQILYLHINHFPRQGRLWILFSFDYLNIIFHLIFQKTCKGRAQKSQHKITPGLQLRQEGGIPWGVTRSSDTWGPPSQCMNTASKEWAAPAPWLSGDAVSPEFTVPTPTRGHHGPLYLEQWIRHTESSGSTAFPSNVKCCHSGGESTELPGRIHRTMGITNCAAWVLRAYPKAEGLGHKKCVPTAGALV